MPAAQGEVLARNERDDARRNRGRKREMGPGVAKYHRVPGDEEECNPQHQPAMCWAPGHRQAVATVK